MDQEENDCLSWTFPLLFQSLDSKIKFSHDLLNAFEQFPSQTRLNCDDFYSLISLICADVPYNFIVFVCECVDPSISSGTIMSHRIPFGNFLLALPCCIVFPYFMQELLSLFKTADTLRRGVINRDTFVEIMHQIFDRFLPPKRDPKDKTNSPLPPPLCKEVEESNGYEKRYPSPSIVEEYEEATDDLGKSSVQTLLFVMWQRNDILLKCKERLPVPDVDEYLPDDQQSEGDDQMYSEPADSSNNNSTRESAIKGMNMEEEEKKEASEYIYTPKASGSNTDCPNTPETSQREKETGNEENYPTTPKSNLEDAEVNAENEKSVRKSNTPRSAKSNITEGTDTN